MTPLFPDLPHPLGAYTLTRLLAVREGSDVYAAKQGSVGREVALEVLHRGASPEQQAAFLLTARARVGAANLPHIGQVYETLCADSLWFLTQELPAGHPLNAFAEGETLSVSAAARIIAAAAELYERCAAARIATLPLSADSIILDEHGDVRFLSPVIGKADDRVDDWVRACALAALLIPLVPDQGVPGATRFSTFCRWMTEGYEGQMLTWAQIRETAAALRTQLGDTDENPAEHPSEAGLQRRRRRRTRAILTAAGAAVLGLSLTAALGSLGILFRSTTIEHVAAVHDGGVTCRWGADHLAVVSEEPVSVGAYADFLRSWKTASPEEQNRCMAGLPPLPTLNPAAWEEQLKHRVSEPVVGVSYWQALVYARFHGADLPSAPALQTARPHLKSSSVDEWTSDTFNGDGHGLIPRDAPLAIRREEPFSPLPLPNREYTTPTLGFRLLLSLPTEP